MAGSLLAVSYTHLDVYKRQVVTLPSGLQYEVITEGNVGRYAKATDRVQCHYEGTLDVYKRQAYKDSVYRIMAWRHPWIKIARSRSEEHTSELQSQR